jgi:hypothetical protein
LNSLSRNAVTHGSYHPGDPLLSDRGQNPEVALEMVSDDDPLAHLSRGPVMDRAGLYIEGGISEYSLEFTRPVRELLEQKRPSESLEGFVLRLEAAHPGVLHRAIFGGLRTNPRLKSEADRDTPQFFKVRLPKSRIAGSRLLPETLRKWGALRQGRNHVKLDSRDISAEIEIKKSRPVGTGSASKNRVRIAGRLRSGT